jgi:hypothetical protein
LHLYEILKDLNFSVARVKIKRVTGKQPLGTMLAVYICMTKCVTSPPLLACTVDGHTLLWKIGNQKSAPFLNVQYFFIKKFTGHACSPGDDIIKKFTGHACSPGDHICQSNCEILPVSDRHLFRGLDSDNIDYLKTAETIYSTIIIPHFKSKVKTMATRR